MLIDLAREARQINFKCMFQYTFVWSGLRSLPHLGCMGFRVLRVYANTSNTKWTMNTERIQHKHVKYSKSTRNAFKRNKERIQTTQGTYLTYTISCLFWICSLLILMLFVCFDATSLHLTMINCDMYDAFTVAYGTLRYACCIHIILLWFEISSVTSHFSMLLWYMPPHLNIIILDIHTVFVFEYVNLMRSRVYPQHTIILWDIHIDATSEYDTLIYSWYFYMWIRSFEMYMMQSHRTIMIWDIHVVTSECDNLRCPWSHRIYICWFWYMHDEFTFKSETQSPKP